MNNSELSAASPATSKLTPAIPSVPLPKIKGNRRVRNSLGIEEEPRAREEELESFLY